MPITEPSQHFTLAQISDSHLFADIEGLHHGANVYQHLQAVVKDIISRKPDVVVFTGDLTQDHSESSYQNFADILQSVTGVSTCYYIPGNHDELALLDKYLPASGFSREKVICKNAWHINLLNSKSATPAGFFNQSEFEQISGTDNKLSTQISSLNQFIFMHHHPIDVGFSIDKHGLTNKADFWQTINNSPQIKGIACGHVHRASILKPDKSGYSKALYTCPATSIQFDPESAGVGALDKPPAYRLFNFYDSGEISTEVIEVNVP